MMKIFLYVVVIGLMLVLMPFAGIWSLNTLFGLTIPFNFDTWCASIILSGIVGGSTGVSFKK